MFPYVDECRGELMMDYSQGDDPALQQLRSTSMGACIGFSVAWIIAQKNDDNFWKDIKGMGKATVIQYQRFEKKTRSKVQNPYAASLERDYSTKIETAAVRQLDWYTPIICRESTLRPRNAAGPPVAISLSHDTTRVAGHLSYSDGYKLLLIWKSSGGGHACASVYEAPVVKYLDPNCGEVWFRDRERFKEWFLKYITCPTANGRSYADIFDDSAFIKHYA